MRIASVASVTLAVAIVGCTVNASRTIESPKTHDLVDGEAVVTQPESHFDAKARGCAADAADRASARQRYADTDRERSERSRRAVAWIQANCPIRNVTGMMPTGGYIIAPDGSIRDHAEQVVTRQRVCPDDVPNEVANYIAFGPDRPKKTREREDLEARDLWCKRYESPSDDAGAP